MASCSTVCNISKSSFSIGFLSISRLNGHQCFLLCSGRVVYVMHVTWPCVRPTFFVECYRMQGHSKGKGKQATQSLSADFENVQKQGACGLRVGGRGGAGYNELCWVVLTCNNAQTRPLIDKSQGDRNAFFVALTHWFLQNWYRCMDVFAWVTM